MKASAPTSDSRSLHDVYAEGLRYLMGEGTLNGALARLSEDLGGTASTIWSSVPSP